jgi:hypothetical protein
LGEGSPCLTSKGAVGFCSSFKQCYPYFKFPDLSIWESWVLGNYDTCSYFNEDGRQAFGVCCTNPITPTPDTNEIDPGNSNQGIEVNQRYPIVYPTETNNPSTPSWPPPIPTHPPDHTAATHPPGIFSPTTAKPGGNPVVTTSTKRPTTTWPTRPTRPQISTRPPLVTTTKATTVQSDPNHGTCGAKNGYADQERIVGGHDADPNEWPWIAALFNGGRQFCGGSLIDSQHILTAAHCVAHMSGYDVARLTVMLGDHNIRTNTEVRHIDRKVKRVVRHRGFDSRTLVRRR